MLVRGFDAVLSHLLSERTTHRPELSRRRRRIGKHSSCGQQLHQTYVVSYFSLRWIGQTLNQKILVSRNPSVVFLMMIQGLSTLPFVWGATLLTVTLNPLHIDQKLVGALIVTTTIVSAIATVLVSRIADMCFRFRLKVLAMLLLPIHTGCMIGMGVCALTGDSSPYNQRKSTSFSFPEYYKIFYRYKVFSLSRYYSI